jgi:general secretion pathway protein L
MSRKVLGLDIRSKIVCAVLVKSSLRESRIAASMSVPIPETEDGSSGLRAALETITSSMDLGGTDCAVSIPALFFSSRNLQMPFPNPKKIRMVLPFEIETLLPYASDELVIDFNVLDGEQSQEQTEVLAVSIEKNKLASFLESLSAVNIDPERVTVSGLSVAFWIGRDADPGQSFLCLDIGETFGAVFVVAGTRVRLIRSFPLSTDPGSRTRTIRNYIRTTLAAWSEAAGSAREPGEVVLTGDGLDSINLEDVANALPIMLKKADLGPTLQHLREETDGAPWDPIRMDGALALALAEIEGIEGLNFHRSQFLGKKVILRYGQDLIKTGALAATVLAFMLASVFTQGYLTKRRLADLDQQIASVFTEAFPTAQKVANPYQQMQINLQELKKNAGLPGETLPTVRSIDILKGISDSIPENISVVIDRMVIGPENILISGTTGAFNAVDEVKGHLERLAGFKKVTISSANTDRSGKEVNFQLKVDL